MRCVFAFRRTHRGSHPLCPCSGCFRCSFSRPLPSLAQASASAFSHRSFAATPEDGQWAIPQKNFANTRYSDLSEINTDNVKNLQVAFTFSTGVNKGQESAPLVVGGDDVRALALSQHSLRPRPDAAGRADEMAVQPQACRGRAGRRLLRRGQSRPHLRQRQDLLHDARCPCGGGECRYGRGGLENQARRHQPGRDHDDGAAGGEGQGDRRHLGRRVRGPRLDPGARCQFRAKRLEGLQHRARSGREDRPELQALLRCRQRQGPRRHHLAGGCLAAGRRHGLGVAVLRSRTEPALSRHRQSRPLEPEPAPRRQQVDRRNLRPRCGYGRGALVLSDRAARPSRLGHHQ